MNQIVISALCALGLAVGMLLLLELGRRIGRRRLAGDAEGARAGTGAVEGAIFACWVCSSPSPSRVRRPGSICGGN